MSAVEQMRGSVEPLRREERRGDAEGAIVDDVDGFVAPGRSPLRHMASAAAQPALVGGLMGAVMAVVAVLALTELRPALDPRLPGLAGQVSGFQTSLYALETAVRGAEVDLVRALDANSALAGRIDEQANDIRTAMAELAAARQQLKLETGPGSVVFGVSVVQLSDAVASGRPFESEWVNLYALTAGHEPLREQLRRLMPVAGAGVPTVAELQRSLRATAAPQAPAVQAANLLQYGLNVIRNGLGVPLGTTAEHQVSGGLLRDADRRLSEGDVAGALGAIANMTEAAARPFQTWVASAQQRQAVDVVVGEFTHVSTEALRARAKDSPS